MKLGLVLEGGAMRGLFTAGVLDVLMENNIIFDGAIGVSAGACFGCNYPSGQIGRTIRYNIKNAKNKDYCSISSLLRTGDIFGAKYCYHDIPEELDIFDKKAFNESPMEFYVVVTDVLTGKPVYHLIDDIDDNGLEWVRASASMPLVSNIVRVEGEKYLDGGIADSIPVKAFENLGYDVNVTVLTKPRGYRKKPNKLMPLIKRVYRNFPSFIHANEIRHIAYNNQLQDVFDSEKAGMNFVICPKAPLPIGHICHDPKVMKETYELGRSEATEMLPALIRFLENHDMHKYYGGEKVGESDEENFTDETNKLSREIKATIDDTSNDVENNNVDRDASFVMDVTGELDTEASGNEEDKPLNDSDYSVNNAASDDVDDIEADLNELNRLLDRI